LLPTVPSKVLKQHEDIYRAIKSRDAAAAREAMWGHLEDTAQLLQQIVRKRGKSSQNGRIRRAAK